MIIKMFNKFKNFRIIALITLLFSLLIIYVFLFSPGLLNRAALALQGDYASKVDGSAISATEWNYLDEDFLWKEGDTMGGDLNMGGNNITNVATPAATDVNYAATVGYVNSMGGASAQDRDGAPLKVVCDSTPQGATNWQNDVPGVVYVDVNTTGLSGANFMFAPYYLTSIGGSGSIWDQYGGNITFATAIGFRLYIKMLVGDRNHAISNGWYVNWCGIGN